jgi:hypothetical protein
MRVVGDVEALLARIDRVLGDRGCHTGPNVGMTTHHCCEPGHRTYDETVRELRRRLGDATSRVRWAEMNETRMAGALADARDEIERLRARLPFGRGPGTD